jgi:DNA-binding CsgD family transcriptional regulator
MRGSLCLHLFTRVNEETEDLTFFESDNWNAESEKELFVKLQELFSMRRENCRAIEVKINMEVQDVDDTLFVVRKKMNRDVEINHQRLSIREIEVLGLIMQGHTNQEIADKLFISYETVRSHRKNILAKTHAKNTAALISHYHQTFFEKPDF